MLLPLEYCDNLDLKRGTMMGRCEGSSPSFIPGKKKEMNVRSGRIFSLVEIAASCSPSATLPSTRSILTFVPTPKVHGLSLRRI